MIEVGYFVQKFLHYSYMGEYLISGEGGLWFNLLI